MEFGDLSFQPEAFGGPVDWDAQSAYLTWNRRTAQQFSAGQFPILTQERLADFHTFSTSSQ